MEINTRQMRALIKANIKMMTDFGIIHPMIFVSSPGVGKTYIIQEESKLAKIGLLFHNGPALDPVDSGGIPEVVTVENERCTQFTKAPILPTKRDGKVGILFVDEIGGAPPAVQVSLQTIFQENLAKGWLPIAATNFTTDRSYANALSRALINRCELYVLKPNLDIWIEDFAIPKGINFDVISFLKFRQDMFCKYENDTKKAYDGMPTPRSWERVSNVLNHSHLINDEYLMVVKLSSLVGQRAGAEIAAFIKLRLNLPNITDIFTKGTLKFNKNEPGLSYAVSSSIVEKLSSFPDGQLDDKLLTNVYNFLNSNEYLPEYTVVTLKYTLEMMKQTKKKNYTKIITSKGFSDFSQKGLLI